MDGFQETKAERYKIVVIDNFNRDNVSDFLYCELAQGVSFSDAKILADLLNEKHGGDYSPNFYKAVPFDYEIYEWEP